MKRIVNLCLPATMALSLALGACSGSQQDEEALAGQDDQAESEQQQQEGYGDEETAETNETDELEQFVNEVPTETQVINTVPKTAPMDADRVVRYVREAGATAFPDAGQSPSLGVFPQGTRLLVVEEGEWARVGDGMFVKANELSAKPIPRTKRNAVWSHPAH